jgi:hypothetical protein
MALVAARVVACPDGSSYNENMIEHLHTHIIEEFRANTRTDTIFILASIFLNLVALAVNSIVAAEDPGSAQYILFFIFVALIVVVNWVVVAGLRRGKQTRRKLLEGLLRIYQDNNIDQYYDASILESYDRRYVLFTIVVVVTGAVAAAVPAVLLFM